jgi:NAD+ kinase
MTRQRAGIVGDGELAGAIEIGGVTAVDEMTDLDGFEFAIAVGEESVIEIARTAADVPVLAVGSINGVPSVPREQAEATIEWMFRNEPRIERHPVVSASGSFGAVRAIFDITLVTAEPARISEFSVSDRDRLIERFRADGVVASTPAGSHGYNRRAGGPTVMSESGVMSVVPIAPFSMSAGQWILPIESLEVSIERDETPVELLADGRRESVIATDDTVEISRVGALEMYVPPELDAAAGNGDRSSVLP